MSTQKERLFAFINVLGYSVREFERSIGVSNGTVRHLNDTVTANVRQKVSAKFPQLNIDWLLTGSGDMLYRSNSITNVNVDMGDSIHHNSAAVVARGANGTHAEDVIAAKDREIEKLEAEIQSLKDQISYLTKSILNLTQQLK